MVIRLKLGIMPSKDVEFRSAHASMKFFVSPVSRTRSKQVALSATRGRGMAVYVCWESESDLNGKGRSTPETATVDGSSPVLCCSFPTIFVRRMETVCRLQDVEHYYLATNDASNF